MKYTFKIIYSDGDEDLSDDIYNTEDEAIWAAQYLISCASQGREIMSLMGDCDDDELEDSDLEYEIVEIDDSKN